jgi:hypothetical protein
MDDRGIGVRFLEGARDLSFLYNSCEGQIVCYKIGARVCFPGVKRQGREANHSPPSSD